MRPRPGLRHRPADARRPDRPAGNFRPDPAAHLNPVPAALILTGGGARAAYQVGVLVAVAELLPRPPGQSRFPILCGTSAGAINAASVACLADNFGKAVEMVSAVWQNMHAGPSIAPMPWAWAAPASMAGHAGGQLAGRIRPARFP